VANYIAQGRSNYFAVKDEDAFLADIANCNVELLTYKTEDGQTLYGFMDAGYGDGLDTWYARSADDDTTSEGDEVTWSEFFQKHLADGWVAIIISIGSEKMRYLNGEATAYNNKGEERFINLEGIVQLGKELGENITTPTY
jgi:hypothetical protein